MLSIYIAKFDEHDENSIYSSYEINCALEMDPGVAGIS